MFDRETNTLWSHLTGEAIEGPLKGRMLEIIISDRSTWGVWRQRYPSAQIMRTDTTDDPYLSYYAAQDTGISSTRHQDGRLGPRSGSSASAWPAQSRPTPSTRSSVSELSTT